MGGFKRPSNENNEKKQMIPLTNKEKESYESQKIFHICVQEFGTDENNKKMQKVREHCHYSGKYRGAAYSICNLRYKKYQKRFQ